MNSVAADIGSAQVAIVKWIDPLNPRCDDRGNCMLILKGKNIVRETELTGIQDGGRWLTLSVDDAHEAWNLYHRFAEGK